MTERSVEQAPPPPSGPTDDQAAHDEMIQNPPAQAEMDQTRPDVDSPATGTEPESGLSRTGVWLVPVLAVAGLVAAVMLARPQSESAPPVGSPAGDDRCRAAICLSRPRIVGKDGRSPTDEQVFEELGAVNSKLALSWHLHASPVSLPTIPERSGYTGFTLFATCTGDGALTVVIESRSKRVGTMKVGCDGMVESGLGFADVSEALVNPYTFHTSLEGNVTDAAFYVIGRTTILGSP
ncbi:hypothetical protein [Catellatospora sichuanensis]|uniref:hypothetical protein n=1 Tax=Catellatospora sichuanensis TaxID=1969805 RepID=UPI001183C084|nr:hypothetical protein [Catellatospora sichuanensis]